MDLQFDYYKNVKRRKIEWLWYPYIAYGKITIIQGDPGHGKSTLAINLASLLSNGKAMPFEENETTPSTVVYQNNEDCKEDTICPRLKSSGANLDRVAYIDESDATLSMDDDRLEKVLEETKAKLLILDPYQAYFGNNADMNRANSTRQVLGKLGRIAQRLGCAVVLIGHMSKTQNTNDLYRALGSIDIPAIARSVLLVSKMPTSDDERIMTQIKNNLAPTGPSLLFQITANGLIKWIKKSTLGADDIINKVEEPKTKLEQASMLLIRLLSRGSLQASAVEEEFKQEGIASRTMYQAKRHLNIKSERKDGKWYWYIAEVDR